MQGQKLRVSMGQLLVEGGEPRRNLERATQLIAQAGGQGAQVIVLPETLDLGWTHPSAQTEAMPIPGPYSDVLCASARDNTRCPSRMPRTASAMGSFMSSPSTSTV